MGMGQPVRAMCRYVLLRGIVFCAILILAPLSAERTTLAGPVPPDAKLIIEGDKRFMTRVTKALILIREKDPLGFQVIRDYVGKIQQRAKSGMAAKEDPPTFYMSDQIALYSVTWCAGSIAHDSYHSKLYHDFRDEMGAVPQKAWAGLKAETRCNRWQLRVMKKIGAPDDELDHLRSADGTHSDINGDGVYDSKDYELRDW